MNLAARCPRQQPRWDILALSLYACAISLLGPLPHPFPSALAHRLSLHLHPNKPTRWAVARCDFAVPLGSKPPRSPSSAKLLHTDFSTDWEACGYVLNSVQTLSFCAERQTKRQQGQHLGRLESVSPDQRGKLILEKGIFLNSFSGILFLKPEDSSWNILL